MAPVEKRVAEAWWGLAVTGSEEAQKELVRAGTEYNRLFADEGEQEAVAGWYGELDSLDDELLRRQVEVLYRTYASKQGDAGALDKIEELEAEANAVYGNHRGTVGGRPVGENEVRDILRTAGDESVRREAWEASKTVGREVEGTVRELARLRNRLAREAGYKDHYHRSLDLQEMDVEELERLMADLESATDAPFRELKKRLDERLREKFGVEVVRPWFLSDPFFQETPEDGNLDTDRFFEGKDLEALTRKTYDSLGLEVRGVVAKSDLYARPGKNQHAFCLPVGRDYPYDVRVLANLRAGKPDAYWMNTMLHEFGHAVYDRHINLKLPYLLRGVSHIATTEAIALMMGALGEEPGWLQSVAGVPEDELASERERLAARRREELLVFTRWALVVFRFEKELYADPDREDLNGVWWDLVEKLQLVPRPPGRDEPDWAAKIHVATAPVYYQNYVLGNLIAAQLRNYLETHITQGPFYQNEVAGRYLLESFFGPGARENWRDTVLRATGEPLDPAHFVSSIR
ncbi:peptidase M3A and M3B thimet/oligopeptidase F [Rubrobacter tropicus]|uniref:Peptidase M3A and M3B thimet/oligopeptidase F n=1 Tax=Rubrobacter tropicus TaxID=2653851 RepID=A0A6G8QFB0_9ACTN|nr:peptidase M3A and M3B thimet/oligopeptidase F [Rubrobacter tropicus]